MGCAVRRAYCARHHVRRRLQVSNRTGRFIAKLVINALALLVAAFVVPKFHLDYKGDNGLVYLLLVALIFSLINTFIRPIVKLVSMPITLITLGLFSFVVNGLLLLLLAWVVGLIQGHGPYALQLAKFPPDISVEAFITAVLGAIVISIVSTILAFFLPD
jgi:putative membrane protein